MAALHSSTPSIAESRPTTTAFTATIWTAVSTTLPERRRAAAGVTSTTSGAGAAVVGRRRRLRRTATQPVPAITRHTPVVTPTAVATAAVRDGKKYGSESPSGSRAACRVAKSIRASAAAASADGSDGVLWSITKWSPRRKAAPIVAGSTRKATASSIRSTAASVTGSTRSEPSTVPSSAAERCSYGWTESHTTTMTAPLVNVRTTDLLSRSNSSRSRSDIGTS